MSIPNLIMETVLMILGVLIALRAQNKGTTIAAAAVFVIGLALVLEELGIMRLISPSFP